MCVFFCLNNRCFSSLDFFEGGVKSMGCYEENDLFLSRCECIQSCEYLDWICTDKENLYMALVCWDRLSSNEL